jgi:ABC-type antimicrobial peptide transport system permease subunit
VNVRIIAGRKFEKDKISDVNESIIVNEEFVRVFELGNDAVGKRITLNDTTQVYITGIVKDVYLNALFQPISQLAFRYVPANEYKYLVASTDPTQLVQVNAQIKDTWKKLFPAMLYPGRLMEERMVMALEHFDAVVILYTFLGLVAIIMSVSGLYSLMSLNLQKRTTELGIRKILGASLPHIVIQSSKLFLVIMFISFGVGSLLGAVMVNGLMGSIWEYYVAINVKVLALAIGILFSIAVFTIGYKIRKVSVTNPVNSLRYE